MTRDEQKDQRRKQILDIALDFFIRKGYAATKTGDIAKAAGMSNGLLFHYFESKEKLYEELVRTGIQGQKNMAAQMDQMEPLVFFQQAASQIFAYVKRFPEAAKLFALMHQVQSYDSVPENIKELMGSFDMSGTSAAIIEAGQKEGTIRSGNPLALSAAYWAVVQNAVEQFIWQPDIPMPEGEWIIDLLKNHEYKQITERNDDNETIQSGT